MTAKNARRDFLKKLALSVGATVAVAATGNAAVSKNLSADQITFMSMYEQWMDAFLEMMEVQQSKPEDLANNKKLMDLSDQAAGFQEQLAVYLKEEDFARYYLQRIDRLVEQIKD